MGRAGKKHIRLGQTESPSFDSLKLVPNGGTGFTPPEDSYAAAVPLPHRRRYAQFFTPPRVAKLMAEWAITPTTQAVLDPAVGTGVLVRAALQRKPDVHVTAFEKDPLILRAFLQSHPALSNVEPILSDFLTFNLTSNYDAALMNPPYLRHHDLSYDFDIFEQFGKTYALELSRLSNAYLLFTLKAASALRAGGRASVIIPTEWMNANFGTAMKSFLVGRGFLRELIYFSSCSDVFGDALTTAAILLLEKPAL